MLNCILMTFPDRKLEYLAVRQDENPLAELRQNMDNETI